MVGAARRSAPPGSGREAVPSGGDRRFPAGVVGLGVLLFVVAGVFAATPLLVGAVTFVALAVGAAAWTALATRGAAIERRLSATRTVEDEPVELVLRVRAGIALPGGTIDEPLLGGAVALRPGARGARIRVAVRFARRGRRELAPPVLRLADPLGLTARAVLPREAEPLEVLVLPRVEPVGAVGGGDPVGSGRALLALAGLAEVEVDGLRAYRPGSPASRIHWPALARGAGLLERRLRPSEDGHPLVVLDPSAPPSLEDLDAAVRAAASLCRHLAAIDGCAALLPGERRARRIERDLGAWPGVWARLAVVEAGPPPPLAALAGRTGAVFYVAARPLTRLPRPLAEAPGARVLVVPAELPSRATFEVAGCRGYALGRVRRAAA
jgi:uncharacterized protein (DUF58 family)